MSMLLIKNELLFETGKQDGSYSTSNWLNRKEIDGQIVESDHVISSQLDEFLVC
jgi:hypothetical protein